MYPFRNSFVIFLCYTVFIVGVLLSSGQNSRRSVYDRYLVQVDGIVIPTKNIEAAKVFFGDFLGFQSEQERESSLATFRIPDGRHLYLVQENESADIQQQQILSPPVVTILQVRNGFLKLHKHFAKSAVPANPILKTAQITVSDIQSDASGETFSVSDSCGHLVKFFSPKKRKFLPM